MFYAADWRCKCSFYAEIWLYKCSSFLCCSLTVQILYLVVCYSLTANFVPCILQFDYKFLPCFMLQFDSTNFVPYFVSLTLQILYLVLLQFDIINIICFVRVWLNKFCTMFYVKVWLFKFCILFYVTVWQCKFCIVLMLQFDSTNCMWNLPPDTVPVFVWLETWTLQNGNHNSHQHLKMHNWELSLRIEDFLMWWQHYLLLRSKYSLIGDS